MSQSFMSWFVILVVLSAAPGWYLSQLDQQRKADLRTRIEQRFEKEKLDFQHKKEMAALSRASALNSQLERVALKGVAPLEHATITAFNDDGVTFSTAGGASHLSWLLLPDDFVQKYHDPEAPMPPDTAAADEDPEKKAAEARARIAQERERLETERKHAAVAQARSTDIGTKHELVVLKGKKALDNVTIKEFHDDGITFTTNTGIAHVTWDELPLEWVAKYRDPMAAQQAMAKKAQEAAELAQMESLGRDVEVAYQEETGGQSNHIGSGSYVTVVSEIKNGVHDVHQRIFVLNLGHSAFDHGPIRRMRIYPTGRQILVDVDNAQKYPVYAGNAAEALQITHAIGLKLTELPKNNKW